MNYAYGLFLNSQFLILNSKRLFRTRIKIIFRWLIAIIYLLSARVALAIETGLDTTAKAVGLKSGDLPAFIGTIIKALLGLVGIAFFVLMLYGGFTWMKARGNEKDVESAKTTITNAIIGLIIVAAAYAVTKFIVEALS